MIRRYLARRKMRWAVRRLRSMTPQHRKLFQLHSLQKRWYRAGLLCGYLAQKRQAELMMANLTDAVAKMDEQGTAVLDNRSPTP